MKSNLIKFLPSYVGSKAQWVSKLERFKNSYIVELFSGSGVLTANLASKAILNDIDPMIFKIFANYNDQIVPDIFTKSDYMRVRELSDWYKYVYCLQKMSFSGVFRYGKNGYNVPVKKIDEVRLKEDFSKSLGRFNKINPVVSNLSYNQVKIDNMEEAVIVLDPPYEGKQASYNSSFDYHMYWEFLYQIEGKCKAIILFDTAGNMPFKKYETRKMRVNGKYEGDIEAMHIFEDSKKSGDAGEQIFFDNFKDILNKEDGFKYDFSIKESGKTIELKTDYYDAERTPNFFFELYSDKEKKSLGGPWRAHRDRVNIFAYFFVKNNKVWFFDTNSLVERLSSLMKDFEEIEVVNSTWMTTGYKIPRELVEDLAQVEYLTKV